MQEEIAVELDWKVQWMRQAMDEVWMFHFLASLMSSASLYGYILTPFYTFFHLFPCSCVYFGHHNVIRTTLSVVWQRMAL